MKTNKKQSGPHWPRGIILSLLMLLGMWHSRQAVAQCCLTSTLTINTGYNPITNSVIPTGTTDPHWMINYNTPGICQPCAFPYTPIGFTPVAPVAPARIVPGAIAFYTASNALSCVNSNFYNTDGTGPGGTQYYTDFIRTFTLCTASSVTVNFNMSVDNGADVYFDPAGVPPFMAPSLFSLPVGAGFNTPNWASPNPGSFTTGPLSPGTHTIYIRAYQYNHPLGAVAINGFHMTMQGTVTSAVPNAIIGEGAGCAGWSFCTLPPITGTTHCCVGDSKILSNAYTGGTWSSMSPGIVSINSVTGVYTGVMAGTAVIVYTDPCGRTTTTTVTVNPNPVVTGPPTVCVGSTIALLASVPGGTWSSSNTSRATVNSSGVVTGVSGGSVIITYTLPTGCFGTLPVTVNNLPTITGPASVCVGSTSTPLTGTPSGGTWSSSDITIATISAGGAVTGVSAGTVVITYTALTGCVRTRLMTVNPNPAPITGPDSVCVGATITLTDATPGGTWSSAPLAIAAIGATTGVVTGSSAGTAIITYLLSTGCNTTRPVTVSPLPTFSYPPLCTGNTYAPTGVTPPGGTWSSSNPAVASIDPLTGMLTCIIPGTSIITYISPAGCQVSHTVTVNLTPAPVIGVNPTPTPDLCIGDMTMLYIEPTSVPGCTLTWTSSNTSVATVAPGYSTSGIITAVGAGTAVITCTAFNPGTGCSGTVTFTVTVHPPPAVTITSVPAATSVPGIPAPMLVMACPDAKLTANSATAVTYAWTPTTAMTPPSGTTATVTVTPGMLTVYTVTVTDSIGCTGKDSIAVTPIKNRCVCDAQSKNIAVHLFAPTGSITMATAGAYTAGNYYMMNNVTIAGLPGDVVHLTGCVVFIDPGLKIDVAPGVKLVLDNCHLFCCNPDMWQGILLNTGGGQQGLIELENNTMIEDADIAINVPAPVTPPGGSLIVHSHGAIFNKNTVGISISRYNPAIPPVLTPTSGYAYPVVPVPSYPFIIENTVFTSRDFYGYTMSGPPTPTSMWPYTWAGLLTPDGLKTPWIPFGTYDPPYNIDNPMACAAGGYPMTTCNDTLPADKGILLSDVGLTTGSLGSAVYSGVTIGSVPTSAANTELNMFDNLRYGIYAINTNVVPRNGTYTHLSGPANIPGGGSSAGIGVYAENTNPSGVNNLYQLWLYGSDGSLLPKKGGAVATNSSFYDCNTAVAAKEYYYMKGEFASMMSAHSAMTTASPAGSLGYDMSSSNYYDVQLNYNNIHNIAMGIKYIAAPSSGTSLYGEIEVKGNNIFAASLPVAPTAGEYVRQAILVVNTAGYSVINMVPGVQVNIEQNHLDHVFNGIYVSDFMTQMMPPVCNDNIINLAQDVIFTPMAAQTGISLININPGFVLHNTISGPGYNVPAPPSHLGLNYNYPVIEGIHINNLAGSLNSSSAPPIISAVGCNTVSQLNTGFYFENNNGFEWENNTMDQDAYGFVINGNINPQLGAGAYCNNLWLPASGFWTSVGSTPNYQTYTMGSTDPSWSPLYVDGSAAATPTEHGTELPAISAYSTGSTIITMGGGTYPACPVLPFTTVGFKQGNNTTGNDNDGVARSVADATGRQGYALYPNPSDGHITIRQLAVSDQVVKAEIWNATGQVVYRGSLSFMNGEAQLNMQTAVPGIYLLKLAGSNGAPYTIRFTVQ